MAPEALPKSPHYSSSSSSPSFTLFSCMFSPHVPLLSLALLALTRHALSQQVLSLSLSIQVNYAQFMQPSEQETFVTELALLAHVPRSNVYLLSAQSLPNGHVRQAWVELTPSSTPGAENPAQLEAAMRGLMAQSALTLPSFPIDPDPARTYVIGLDAVSQARCSAGKVDVSAACGALVGLCCKDRFTCFENACHDRVPPVVICPANPAVMTTTWGPSINGDNSAQALSVVALGPEKHPPATSFPKGVTEVGFLHVDTSGNRASCFLQVRVNDFLNTPAPGLLCPADVSVVAASVSDEVRGTIVTYPNPTTSDGSTAFFYHAAAFQKYKSGQRFPLGNTTVQWTAENLSLKTSTCTFVVRVYKSTMSLSCPPVLVTLASAPYDSSSAGTFVTWNLPVLRVTRGHLPDLVFPAQDASLSLVQTLGPTRGFYTKGAREALIGYQASFAMLGKQGACNFTVTVNDTTAPTWVFCPSKVVKSDLGLALVMPGQNYSQDVAVSYAVPSAIDNSPGLVYERTKGFASAHGFPYGETMVEWQVMDSSGNTPPPCSFIVEVVDNTPPKITCPANIQTRLSSSSTPSPPTPATTTTPPVVTTVATRTHVTVTWPEPVGTDNRPHAYTTLLTPLVSGSNFTLGQHVVSYRVRDEGGRDASCSFTVSVLEASRLTLSGCPASISAPLLPGDGQGVFVPRQRPNVVNAVGGFTLFSEPPQLEQGGYFLFGSTEVVVRAQDARAYTGECRYTVTVVDLTPPKFTRCPAGQIRVPNSLVSYETPEAQDNHDGPGTDGGMTIMRTRGPASPGVLSLGTHTVTYVARDSSGNLAECSFDLVIVGGQGGGGGAGLSPTPAAVRSDRSCYSVCGKSAGKCWCDKTCGILSDCCADHDFFCNQAGGHVNTLPPPTPAPSGGVSPTQPQGSCVDNCGTTPNFGLCWCLSDCVVAGDCCPDYWPVCLGNAAPPPTLPPPTPPPPSSPTLRTPTLPPTRVSHPTQPTQPTQPTPFTSNPLLSCAGRCASSPASGQAGCSCSVACKVLGGCCTDFLALCVGTNLPLSPSPHPSPPPTSPLPAAVSCKDSCGVSPGGGCYCDAACSANDDCCGDFTTRCPDLDSAHPGGTHTCAAGGCGLDAGDCFCDAACSGNNDCCSDFATICPTLAKQDPFQPNPNPTPPTRYPTRYPTKKPTPSPTKNPTAPTQATWTQAVGLGWGGGGSRGGTRGGQVWGRNGRNGLYWNPYG